jgi:hypothetical protein
VGRLMGKDQFGDGGTRKIPAKKIAKAKKGPGLIARLLGKGKDKK